MHLLGALKCLAKLFKFYHLQACFDFGLETTFAIEPNNFSLLCGGFNVEANLTATFSITNPILLYAHILTSPRSKKRAVSHMKTQPDLPHPGIIFPRLHTMLVLRALEDWFY
jgi:hypothetical protein